MDPVWCLDPVGRAGRSAVCWADSSRTDRKQRISSFAKGSGASSGANWPASGRSRTSRSETCWAICCAASAKQDSQRLPAAQEQARSGVGKSRSLNPNLNPYRSSVLCLMCLLEVLRKLGSDTSDNSLGIRYAVPNCAQLGRAASSPEPAMLSPSGSLARLGGRGRRRGRRRCPPAPPRPRCECPRHSRRCRKCPGRRSRR